MMTWMTYNCPTLVNIKQKKTRQIWSGLKPMSLQKMTLLLRLVLAGIVLEQWEQYVGKCLGKLCCLPETVGLFQA